MYWCCDGKNQRNATPELKYTVCFIVVSENYIFDGQLPHWFGRPRGCVYKQHVQLSKPRPASETRPTVSERHESCDWTTPQARKEPLIPSILNTGIEENVLL